MKKKKILITVLILVLVCLSACGKKEVDSNSKDNLLSLELLCYFFFSTRSLNILKLKLTQLLIFFSFSLIIPHFHYYVNSYNIFFHLPPYKPIFTFLLQPYSYKKPVHLFQHYWK